MTNSYYILEDIISNLNNLDGIVAYSLFQMPENKSKRNEILKKILKKKKIMCFAVEQIILSKVNQLKKINKIWEIKQTLPFCLK